MPQKVFLTFIVLLFVWVLIAGFSKEEIMLGVAVSGIVALISSREFIKGSVIPKLHPRNWFYAIFFSIVFIIEEVISHLDLILRMVTGKINPGIVKIKTKFKNPVALTLLGNAITLTPGTLTLDIKNGEMVTYCLDKESKRIEKRFDWILEKVFGRSVK